MNLPVQDDGILSAESLAQAFANMRASDSLTIRCESRAVAESEEGEGLIGRFSSSQREERTKDLRLLEAFVHTVPVGILHYEVFSTSTGMLQRVTGFGDDERWRPAGAQGGEQIAAAVARFEPARYAPMRYAGQKTVDEVDCSVFAEDTPTPIGRHVIFPIHEMPPIFPPLFRKLPFEAVRQIAIDGDDRVREVTQRVYCVVSDAIIRLDEAKRFGHFDQDLGLEFPQPDDVAVELKSGDFVNELNASRGRDVDYPGLTLGLLD